MVWQVTSNDGKYRPKTKRECWVREQKDALSQTAFARACLAARLLSLLPLRTLAVNFPTGKVPCDEGRDFGALSWEFRNGRVFLLTPHRASHTTQPSVATCISSNSPEISLLSSHERDNDLMVE